MADPLWTEAEAKKRAIELVAQFDQNPDVLSPDEQALAMTLRSLLRAGDIDAARARELIDEYQELWEEYMREWERRGMSRLFKA
jgi:hypothetical protein